MNTVSTVEVHGRLRESLQALGPGNYNVITRDAANITCIIVLNNALQITQPAVLNAVVTTTMVTCNGANDGIINNNCIRPAVMGHMNTALTEEQGGRPQEPLAGLAPGTYDVRIRDAVNTACVISTEPGR